MSRILTPVLLIGTLALPGAARQATSLAPKEEKAPPKADVRGEVTRVVVERNSVTGLLIEGKKETDTKYDRAFVTVSGTKVYTWKDGKKAAAKIGDIKVGSRVQSVFTDAPKTSTSTTVFAKAGELLILAPPRRR